MQVNVLSEIGFVCSTWDLFHAGHVHFLSEAHKYCDTLIVGLQTSVTDRPKKNRPIQTVFERYTQIKGSMWVDEIIPYETEADLKNLLHTLGPHVRLLGTEYLNSPFTGMELYYRPLDGVSELRLEDGEIHVDNLREDDGYFVRFINRGHTWSTSDLRSRVASAQEAEKKPEASF